MPLGKEETELATGKRKSHGVGRGFARVLLTLLLIGVLCACFCGIAFAYYVHAYINPSIEDDIASMSTGMGLDLNSFIYAVDENGQETLYETVKGLEDRIWVDGDSIPKNLKNAIVAIEDERFYQHKGVDWKRTFGAALEWVGSGGSYGGSTITQQLIKNMTNDDDYSVKRKVTEIFRALALENKIDDKERILEMYLNTIYLGRNKYGVKTASATYFGKDVSELDLAECAVLAGITNNPSLYDPYTYPEKIKKRQETILGKMLELGMISQADHDAAVAEELNYRSVELYNNDLTDPYSYFTDAVIKDVIQDLMDQKGYSELVAENMVNSGGLKIYATIDTRIQQIMDEEYKNNENFPDMERDGLLPQSAMVITDKQGNIKGIVGGRGEKEGKRTFSRATDARRQPGSSIKPISTYGPAMDAGIIVPTSTAYDKPLKEVNGKPWPRNDSGKYTGGAMVIKNALAHSINTIAVQVMNMLTPQASYDFMTQRLGIKLVGNRTNADGSVSSDIDLAPLALGGLTDGVTVREMAGAFSSFINDGVFAQTRTYTKVLDSEGNVVLENNPRDDLGFRNVRTAYYMLECMQGTTSFGTATGATISGVQTAGKTGTTSANYDRWFCGLTPKYSGAVWFGFDQQYTLTGLWGNPAANMWTKIMRRVHEGDSNLVFDSHPQDFETASYCMDSGLAPSGACRAAGRVATGRFYKGQAPTEICKHKGYKTYDLGQKNGIDVPNEEEEAKKKEEEERKKKEEEEKKKQEEKDKANDPSVDPETGLPVTPPNQGGNQGGTPGGESGGSQGGNSGGETGGDPGGESGGNTGGESGGNGGGGDTAPPSPDDPEA